MRPVASFRRHARPQFVERDAVVESCTVDHLAVAHPHHPGVAVVVGPAVIRDPLPSQTTITVSPSAWTERTRTGRNPSIRYRMSAANRLVNAPVPANRRPEPNDQASTSESSIRLPKGSAKNASLRLIAGKTHGSATILTPRARSWASVSSTLATWRQKWW